MSIRHSPCCNGHVYCPQCGGERCGRVVVWDPGDRPAAVVCLRCYKVLPVREPDKLPPAGTVCGDDDDPDPGPDTEELPPVW